jgi:hypothetical protein
MSQLKADGFDAAILGVDSQSNRIIYDKSKMVQILIDEGMEEDDAIEYLEFNTWSAYVGAYTPIYLDPLSTDDEI